MRAFGNPIAGGPRRPRRAGRPLLMGVLNVTPDSFSDGGKFMAPREAVRQGLRLAADGADLIDVGGESTRPGSSPVPVAEELRRTVPVIRRLRERTAVPISIDTWKAAVARRALAAGATIVNDVTALRGDPDMADVVRRAKARVILMHMQGTPRTMQRRPRYRDVVADVAEFLRSAARRAVRSGIPASRILVDPGIGFGKTVEHNLLLIRHLDRLAGLGYPVVIGPSRKSFIGRLLGAPVEDRLAGTLACAAAARARGVAVIRVHDVRPARDLLAMLEAIDGPVRRGSGGAR
ncbi:MAG TPA: dihydropteroate synthase [bacterium]